MKGGGDWDVPRKPEPPKTMMWCRMGGLRTDRDVQESSYGRAGYIFGKNLREKI
jgi:hypothetical protein